MRRISDNDRSCALYARNAVKDELRLNNQVFDLQRFCSGMGWRRWIIYKDDGFSGNSPNRPAFKKMMKDIGLKKINTVVITNISRLSRSTAYSVDMLKFLSDNNVDLISVDDQCNDLTFHQKDR